METARARILVVDDDPGLLRSVARILGRQHQVEGVTTPAEALDVASQVKPHVAIIDIHMPDMNGFELLRKLRATRPDVDVIIMTGDVSDPDANLIRAIDEGAFYFIHKPFDRRVLQTLVSRCVELRRLRHEKQQQMSRLEQELIEARKFQLSFLPPERMEMRGVRIAARYISCNALAGDFFDYAPAGDDAVAVLVADVVGHGASAAMMTGIVKSAFHAAHVDEYEPWSVAMRVSDSLRSFDASRFVTLVCARFDCRNRLLTYANAGHPAPILRKADSATVTLDPTGPLICSAFDNAQREQKSVSFADQDSLLLYTDGVLDVQGGAESFGRQRLTSLLTHDGPRGDRLLNSIVSEIQAFTGSRPFEDDITLLTVDVV